MHSKKGGWIAPSALFFAGGLPSTALLAARERATVEVEMVLVRCIVFRPEGDTEVATRATMNFL
jgi:hypothetical protein